MNILLLHSSSDIYGASRILLDVITLFLKWNHKVTVVLSEDGSLVEKLHKMGVQVSIFKLAILRRKYFTPFGLLNRLVYFILALIKINYLNNNNKYDLVYSNTSAVLVGGVYAKLFKIKHVWHIHEIIQKPVIFAKFLSRMMWYFSSINIVVSKEVKKYWQGLYPRIMENTVVIYNGINASDYQSDERDSFRSKYVSADDIVIGMIARVHYWKGQDYFLEIAHHILKKHKRVKFIMVGDAFPGYEYLYEKIEKIKNRYSLTSHVIDLGYRTDVKNVLSGLDIIILPSTLPDPLPTTVLEAMSASLPVVATNHGGAKEMVEDGITGYLIPWDNAAEAAEKINYLIEHKQQMKEMGIKGYERVAKYFSPLQFENELLKLFSDKIL